MLKLTEAKNKKVVTGGRKYENCAKFQLDKNNKFSHRLHSTSNNHCKNNIDVRNLRTDFKCSKPEAF